MPQPCPHRDLPEYVHTKYFGTSVHVQITTPVTHLAPGHARFTSSGPFYETPARVSSSGCSSYRWRGHGPTPPQPAPSHQHLQLSRHTRSSFISTVCDGGPVGKQHGKTASSLGLQISKIAKLPRNSLPCSPHCRHYTVWVRLSHGISESGETGTSLQAFTAFSLPPRLRLVPERPRTVWNKPHSVNLETLACLGDVGRKSLVQTQSSNSRKSSLLRGFCEKTSGSKPNAAIQESLTCSGDVVRKRLVPNLIQ